jgi:putative Mg2+ transporter-C (MgtC) family protein
MSISWELKVVGEVALAILLGGLIGLEREVANRPAGFRTHMLVAGAAAMLVGLGHALVRAFHSDVGFNLQTDPVRIVEAIVTGVSFLGAGTIFRRHRGDRDTVEGLTTAASLLLSSAIGVAVAVQQFTLAVAVTVLALVVLRGVRKVENWVGQKKARSSRASEHSDPAVNSGGKRS